MPQLGDAQRIVPLGKALSVLVTNQIVMEIGGRGDIQNGLQKTMDMRAVLEICAAGDERHAVQHVVDNNGQVV